MQTIQADNDAAIPGNLDYAIPIDGFALLPILQNEARVYSTAAAWRFPFSIRSSLVLMYICINPIIAHRASLTASPRP